MDKFGDRAEKVDFFRILPSFSQKSLSLKEEMRLR